MREHLDSLSRLARARGAHREGSQVPHTVVVLPSYGVSESQLARYAHLIPALEHRQMLLLLNLARVPGARMVFVTSLRPEPEVTDYYLGLLPEEQRESVKARARLIEVPDRSPRSITAKLLDRPDLVDEIRRTVQGGLAYVEPWNVTPVEMELGRRLGMPLNGTAAELWPLGFKSNGRKLMREAGVPLPLGREDVRSVEDVVAAAEGIRAERARAVGAVIKTDNGATGVGNQVLSFAELPGERELRGAVGSLEPRYLLDLARGAVVEELIAGAEVSSPSVQIDLAPGGRVEVIATHDQLLGGASRQEYVGCKFPADPDYRSQITAYGEAVGEVLACRGAVGRFGVDFAGVRSGRAGWELYGLEINLRKTGTMHPLAVLQNLVPGEYDPLGGRWLSREGSQRCYRSTDNMVLPSWHGRRPTDVISLIRSGGLELDRRTGTGVVLHMFSGLDIDGRIGLTAIGVSRTHADALYAAAVAALSKPGSLRARRDPG